MKTKLMTLLGALTMATTTACAHQAQSENQTASYIEMNAAEGQTDAFAQFLTGAAPMVKETEPGTKLWFALQGPNNKLAIFDIFADEAARGAHFSGVVAGALNENADTLVDGGWDAGVVANINNSTVLSEKAPVDIYTATTATYIKLKAASGKGDKLAELLTAAGSIVTETEPKTLYWAALRIDQDNFAIYDIFADDSGRADHFAGKVAGMLKEASPVLVEGGWNDGVVANVNNFDILAIK